MSDRKGKGAVTDIRKGARGSGGFAPFLPEPACSAPYNSPVRVSLHRSWVMRYLLKAKVRPEREVRPPTGFGKRAFR